MTKYKFSALMLSLALALALLSGCAPKQAAEPTPTPEAAIVPETTPEPDPVETPAPDLKADYHDVNLGLLKGPTGMGAAKLLADNEADAALVEAGTYEGTLTRYIVTLGSDPATEIVPKLINGELDIAAVPTNLAATLYNKTEGGVKLLALNTLGVLHILENGDTVHSLSDLAGKTLYATGQGANPEYVLNYLLERSGLTPGEDVTVEWVASDELTALMASGEINLCMLPVPAVTSVMMQNQDVRDAIDLNDAWTEAGAEGTFTMGCLVARTQWLEDNEELVAGILSDYAASIAYANDYPDEAAALMEQFEIVPKAAVAKAAIPQANLVYVDGRNLMDIASYYEVLFAADPTSIGGAIPDDAFYYIP